ncbi:small-conductance mechanosensitive channel [Scopulibacillus daqui]|uniref:Small-conductance mechanosensitive channel n=1 Tax=Scopulibacillus daqui TaxID=1469162 RepID=A0ABS2PXG9_9BACL|nr:DUF3899 domain-containing protein [Scopulibacillus daqui]MBM7644017.1 small-conductance mechanosensitive channel [Scopulibacillus daqui]
MTTKESGIKHYAIAFVIELLLTVLFMVIRYHQFNLLSFANALALSSLALLIVGLIVWIIQGGFFDGFILGFKLFKRASRKRRAAKLGLDDEEEDVRIHPHAKWPMSYPFILTGMAFFIVSMLLSYTVI